MIIDYLGAKEISGPLLVLKNIPGIANEEMVEIRTDGGAIRQGRVVQVDRERTVIQVFQGTSGISLDNTKTRFLGHPIELPLSSEMLGRVFDGAG